MLKHEGLTSWALGLVGAVAGGLLGYFAFFLLVHQGLYAMVLPGALAGIGCGFLSGRKSNGLGVVCALLAVALGVFTEWHFSPFVRDDSFSYFVTHLHQLRKITLLMIAFGGFFGFWFGRGRESGVWIRRGDAGRDEKG